MDTPKIASPRLSVVLDDGAAFEVQTRSIDLIAYEREQARRKWPGPKEAPFSWLTFLAWSALRREGSIPAEQGLTTYTERQLSVTSADDDDDDLDDDAGSPGRPDPGLD